MLKKGNVPFRKRKPRLTRGKLGVKHSGTLIDNIGTTSVPTEFEIIRTDTGARTIDGFPQTIQNEAATDEICRVGDLIRYVNIHIQAAARDTVAADNGWLEYAIVTKREGDVSIPITRTGTQTLGDIATQMYRNECIWTGFFPIGRRMPNGAELRIKLPSTKMQLHIGDQVILYVYFRSQLSTSMESDNIRVILSYNYKAYS